MKSLESVVHRGDHSHVLSTVSLITSLPEEGGEVLWWVHLWVCVSVCSRISKTIWLNFTVSLIFFFNLHCQQYSARDVCCCYRCLETVWSVCLSVCLCVALTGMSCKNGWKNVDAAWAVDLSVLDEGVDKRQLANTIEWSKTAASWAVATVTLAAW